VQQLEPLLKLEKNEFILVKNENKFILVRNEDQNENLLIGCEHKIKLQVKV